MKAAVYTRFGPPDVMEIKDVEKPDPKENEVLVEVFAASVNALDKHIMTGTPSIMRMAFGLFSPKWNILGAEVAGKVEAVGANVKEFKVGDEVVGDLSGFGGYAEYVCAPEHAFVLKPPGVSFEECATIPVAAQTALHSFRSAKLEADQDILLIGAGGGVGIFSVQLAKVMGAKVTAVCSTNKVEMVRSIGADHVIDYCKEELTGQYDLIMDLAAQASSPAVYRDLLKPGGLFLNNNHKIGMIMKTQLPNFVFGYGQGKRMGIVSSIESSRENCKYLLNLLAEGKIKSVIGKRFPLSEMKQAMTYMCGGHVFGKTVIIPKE